MQNKNINKINAAILNDIYDCVNFNKNLLYKICFLIKSVVILVIIIKYNLYIAFAIIAVSVISFFLLQVTDKKIQKHNLALSSFKTQSLELFNSIQQGADTEQSENASLILKDKYFAFVENTIKSTNRVSLFYNINNNFITLILKTTIFASTLYLITLIKSTTLTLSLYLILTPYLTSSAQNLISFFDLFSEFGTVENALASFDALKFQTKFSKEEKFEISTFNLYFFHTETDDDKSNTKLTDLNLNLNHKQFNIIVGEDHSGKETVFNLLNKKIHPSSGSIFIDNKNIESIDKNTYSKIISFTSKTPYFYNISIFENLYLVCQNKTKILKTLADFGLKNEISKLQDKHSTLVSENLNPALLYFLGIARSYLSGAKIICIYGSPELGVYEKELFEIIINKLKKECSVLLFLNTANFDELADNIFYFEKGKLKNKKSSSKNTKVST